MLGWIGTWPVVVPFAWGKYWSRICVSRAMTGPTICEKPSKDFSSAIRERCTNPTLGVTRSSFFAVADEQGTPCIRHSKHAWPGTSIVQRDRRLWQRAQAGYLCERYGRAVFMIEGGLSWES